MASIETIFSSIESAYRRTESKIMSLVFDDSKREKLVAQCMELFQPLYLDQPSLTGLEAYFRYLVHDVSTVSDVPFNFLLTEDEKTDRIIQTFLDALKLITGEEQNARSVDEQQLLSHCDEELSELGGCSVYMIKNCSSTPMTSDDRIAWNVVAGLFELTPRIVKILCAPKDVIETRFREVDHIYYRVFRNSIRTREATPTEVRSALVDNLKERGFGFSQDFLDEIQLYVDTVYPKADLKEEKFVTDLVERVVHRYYEKKRSGMELDGACVPFYRRPEEAAIDALPDVKPETAADEVKEAEEKEVEEVDGLLDEYEAAGKPAIKNLLVVSLSTFPYRLNQCVYLYKGAGQEPLETEAYYYQQEPFPLRLREYLQDSGEILMLTTPETRRVVEREKEGVPFRKSAQAYFVDAVRSMPGLDGVLFKSITVDQDNPIDAVSQVVEHLRTVRRSNGMETLQIYLGTNGGLRGTQLLLEAVLSLLSADGITVSPEHVWSMRALGKDKWEVFNSAAEFKIFDFVSGINEFLNYGRTASLEAFLDANPEIKDAAAEELLECIKGIAKGIQFCSISGFESGLNRLREYYSKGTVSDNLYIEMFRENIKNDYGSLLNADREALDEVKWCVKKGFFQQAITLIESVLPRDFIAKQLIQYDDETYAAACRLKRNDEDPDSYIFNNSVIWHIRQLPSGKEKGKEWRNPKTYDWPNKKDVKARVQVQFATEPELGPNVGKFRDLLKVHSRVKEIRNGINHVGENAGRTPDDYQKVLTEYVDRSREMYQAWKAGLLPPLLYIRHKPVDAEAEKTKTTAKKTPKYSDSEVVLSVAMDAAPAGAPPDNAAFREIGGMLLKSKAASDKNCENSAVRKGLATLERECRRMAKRKTLDDVKTHQQEFLTLLRLLALRQQIEFGYPVKPGSVTWGVIRDYLGHSDHEIYEKVRGWIAGQLCSGADADCKNAIYGMLFAAPSL